MASRAAVRLLRRPVCVAAGNRGLKIRPLDYLVSDSTSIPSSNWASSSGSIGTLKASSILSSSRTYSSVAATSKVVSVKDDQHYLEIMTDLKSKPVLGVVYFTAQWCGPCKQISPYLDQLSGSYDDVTFVKIDVDKVELESTMKTSSITVVPTFHFHKMGEFLGELNGAAHDKLKSTLEGYRKSNQAKSDHKPKQ